MFKQASGKISKSEMKLCSHTLNALSTLYSIHVHFQYFCHCKISYLCKGGKNPARLTSPNNPEAEEVAATSSS